MIWRKIQEYVSLLIGILELERRNEFKTTTIMILKQSFMYAIMTIKNEKG